jgi:hypothetical protein
VLADRQSIQIPKPTRFHGFAHARDAWSWPDRRKGLSNFLTWSFFLAEIIAADLFFGKGAHAAQGPDDGGTPTSDGGHPPYDDPSVAEWRSKGDDALPQDANSLFHPNFPQLDPHYSESAAMPALTGAGAPDAAILHAGGGGGGGGGAGSLSFSHDSAVGPAELGTELLHAGAVPGTADAVNEISHDGVLAGLDPGIAASLGLELNPLQFDVGLGTDLFSGAAPGETIDLKALGLDVTIETSLLSDLLGGGDSSGDGLPGGSLGLPVSSLVEDVTGLNLTGPVHGLQSLLSASDSHLDQGSDAILSNGTSSVAGLMSDATHALSLDLTGGGSLVFPTAPAAQSADGLFDGVRYTDYNLALQTDAGSGSVHAEIGVGVTGETQDQQPASDDHNLAQHADQTGHAVDVALTTDLASADHELLRGLSI